MSANAAMVDAANTANAGLSGCSSNAGKALYNCVADVLDRLAAGASGPIVAKTRARCRGPPRAFAPPPARRRRCRRFQRAARRSRRAAAGRAIGGKYVEGWGGGQGGGAGLEGIVGVLSKAAALIQSKG